MSYLRVDSFCKRGLSDHVIYIFKFKFHFVLTINVNTVMIFYCTVYFISLKLLHAGAGKEGKK